MDKSDKPVSDKDFDTLHGLLAQTDAPQKYETIIKVFKIENESKIY